MTPGRRLYELYSSEFAYRWGGRPLPWDKLPTWQERNTWERIAEDFLLATYRTHQRVLSDSSLANVS